MAIIVLVWFSHFIVFMASGHSISKILTQNQLSWFCQLVLGYCFLSAISMVYSFFFPTNMWLHGMLFLSGMAYLKYNNISIFHFFSHSKHEFIFKILIFLGVLILSVPNPNHGDSSFYHAQSLQWVEQYKAIPGLGNIFTRIAFNSSFFNAQALFSFYPFSTYSSRFLNSFLILCWLIFLAQELYKPSNSSQEKIMALFFLFCTLFISRGWVSSVAPDVAVGIFMLIICFYCLKKHFFDATTNAIFLPIVIATAITIKLSAGFTLLIFLCFDLKSICTPKKWIFPSIFLFIWIVRNLIISGYIAYPYFPVYGFALDWAIPSEIAQIEEKWIASWARMPGIDYNYVLSLPLTTWFPVWFKAQSSINKIFTAIFSISYFLCIVYLCINYVKHQKIEKKIIPGLIWGFVLLVWFITAPDFRFAYGFVLPFFIYLFFVFMQNRYIHSMYLIAIQYIYMVVFVGFIVYVIKKENVPLLNHFIFPQQYIMPKTYDLKINATTIHVAPLSADNCWNTPIPCVNEEMFPKNIEMIGNKIEDGFRPMQNK